MAIYYEHFDKSIHPPLLIRPKSTGLKGGKKGGGDDDDGGGKSTVKERPLYFPTTFAGLELIVRYEAGRSPSFILQKFRATASATGTTFRPPTP